MTTTKLPYTDYLLPNHQKGYELQMAKGMGKSTSKLHYIKPHIHEWESAYNSCRQYEAKLRRIGHTRQIHGYLMSKNEPPPTCRNAVCGD